MSAQAKVRGSARSKAKPKTKAKAKPDRGKSNITGMPNPGHLEEKTVTLDGAERAHIMRMVEKVAPGARTALEKRLLLKVR